MDTGLRSRREKHGESECVRRESPPTTNLSGVGGRTKRARVQLGSQGRMFTLAAVGCSQRGRSAHAPKGAKLGSHGQLTTPLVKRVREGSSIEWPDPAHGSSFAALRWVACVCTNGKGFWSPSRELGGIEPWLAHEKLSRVDNHRRPVLGIAVHATRRENHPLASSCRCPLRAAAATQSRGPARRHDALSHELREGHPHRVYRPETLPLFATGRRGHGRRRHELRSV